MHRTQIPVPHEVVGREFGDARQRFLGLRNPAMLGIKRSQIRICQPVAGAKLQRFPVGFFGFGYAAGGVISLRQAAIGFGAQRIQADGAPVFGDGFLGPPRLEVNVRQIDVSPRRLRVQGDGAAPQLQRLLQPGRILRNHVFTPRCLAIAGVGQGIVRILLHRPPHQAESAVQISGLIPALQQTAPFQIQGVGAPALGFSGNHARAGRRLQPDFQEIGHLIDQRFLQSRHLIRRAYHLPRSELANLPGVDQIGDHADLAAALLHASRDREISVEGLPDFCRAG